MALELLIDGDDYIAELIDDSLEVSQTGDGLNSTCSFDLIDRDVIDAAFWTVGTTHVTTDGHVITDHVVFAEPKVEVDVKDGPTTYFKGTLVRADYQHFGDKDMRLHCECQDFNQMLEESVVDDLEEYGAMTDEEIIDDLWPKYVTGVGKDAHVTGPFVSDEISFEHVTIRSVLDTLAAKSNYKWFVDYNKELHYDKLGADAPAWHLSDKPDYVNSFPFFDDITKELDSANLVNMIFVVGGSAALWFQDVDSKAKYGEHKAIIRDTNLIDIDDMEDRGQSILDKSKDPVVTYKVRTYKDGLRAGMNVRLVCSLYDVDDTFLISSLTITFPVDGDPVYEINCGGLQSSPASSAQRAALDAAQKAALQLGGSSLALAGRGWSHGLTFSATNFQRVDWDAETIYSAGGIDFNIDAGNTGNMAADTVYYVYLNTDIITTELRVTTAPAVALASTNCIMVAVCWRGIEAAGAQPEVLAGYQVFGGGAGTVFMLNADNVAANAITANEIFVNSLQALSAHMGTLTSGLINIEGPAGTGRIALGVGGVALYDVADNLRIWLNAVDGTFEITTADAGDRMELDTAGLRFYDGADLLIDLNKTNAVFSMKSALAGDRVELDVDGLRFYDGVNLLIDLNATNATFSLKSGVAGSARIEISNSEIVGYDGADVKQFYLSAADGVAYAGAGAVILDENGLRFLGAGASGGERQLRFMYDDAGTERAMGSCYGDWGGGAGQAIAWLRSNRAVGDPWPANVGVILMAADQIAGTDVRLYVLSGGVVSVDGSDYFSTNADVRVGEGLYVGGLGVNPPDNEIVAAGKITAGTDVEATGDLIAGDDCLVTDDVRAGGGLIVGNLGIDPVAGRIYTDGANTDGTKGWELGGEVTAVAYTRGLKVWINGVGYTLQCRKDGD